MWSLNEETLARKDRYGDLNFMNHFVRTVMQDVKK